jgi:aspartate carbamoyltransferase regulatory subunit
MNTNKEALQVSALCNGTVIDHIPADKLFAVVNLLDIPSMTTNVTIGYNLKSRKLGTKGLIKVADKFFTDDEVNRISLVAPNVVLNTIRDYQVVEKREVKMPEKITGIVKCPNPKCVTNNEPMTTIFEVASKENGTIKCHYCEKETSIEKITLL